MRANFLLAGLLLAIACPLPMGADESREIQQLRRDMMAFEDKIIREINKQRAAFGEDLRAFQEQRATLAASFQDYVARIDKLEREIAFLRNDISERRTNEENARLEQQAQVDRIKSLMIEERTAMTKSYNDLARQMNGGSTNVERGLSRPGATPAGSYKMYTVVKGDTLGAIAKAFDLSLSQLKDLNGLQSDTIYGGQQLKIPDTGTK